MGSVHLDHRTFLRSLDAETRSRLSHLSDGPGVGRLALHGGLFLGFGAAIFAGLPGWQFLLVPQGVLIAFLFTLQHECTHKTPFRTDWLNEVIGHVSGFLIFQPFLWFRYFHLAHHRFTNIPGRDPELDGASKPDTRRELIEHLLSLRYWRDKVRVLTLNATGNVAGAFVPPNARRRVVKEGQILASLYGLALVLCIIWPGLLFAWIVPLVIGFPVLRLYLLAEHGRCAHVDDMFRNSRTVFTNALVRIFSWNMPYHAEHHAMPSVPFHKLPEFHEVTRKHLRETAPGYRQFVRDYAAGFDT